MNREKVAAFIQRIRKEHHLSQRDFGDKYYVSYQAVSKWETGKNLPDIAILRQICEDYHEDLNSLLDVPINSKKNNKKMLFFIILILFLILSIFLFFLLNRKDEFQMKKLTTTCDDFTLYGSIAYDEKKTSVYISNISYCGKEDKTVYDKIECTLYENEGDAKTKFQTVENTLITLEDFLKNVNFQFDHYSENCKMYEENGLSLEIQATNANKEVRFFEIPLTLDC